jgi:hypothetical protein
MATDKAAIGLNALLTAGAADGQNLPPVHLWNPPLCKDMDLVIRADGVWMHEGTPISRPAMVRLFSTVLRKDPDGFHLVTPVEKLRITVEDAPFLAVALEQTLTGDGKAVLTFRTNVGDVVEAGPDHPIRVVTNPRGEPRPYVHVRAGLEALIGRAVFYDLVAMAEIRATDEGGDEAAVLSNGAWFSLGSVT